MAEEAIVEFPSEVRKVLVSHLANMGRTVALELGIDAAVDTSVDRNYTLGQYVERMLGVIVEKGITKKAFYNALANVRPGSLDPLFPILAFLMTQTPQETNVNAGLCQRVVEDYNKRMQNIARVVSLDGPRLRDKHRNIHGIRFLLVDLINLNLWPFALWAANFAATHLPTAREDIRFAAKCCGFDPHHLYHKFDSLPRPPTQ